MVRQPKAGHAWHADHVTAVFEVCSRYRLLSCIKLFPLLFARLSCLCTWWRKHAPCWGWRSSRFERMLTRKLGGGRMGSSLPCSVNVKRFRCAYCVHKLICSMFFVHFSADILRMGSPLYRACRYRAFPVSYLPSVNSVVVRPVDTITLASVPPIMGVS